MHSCRLLLNSTSKTSYPKAAQGIPMGRSVFEKVLERKLRIDEQLVSILDSHLPKLTTKDCLKLLSLSKTRSPSSGTSITRFVSDVRNQLRINLQSDSVDMTVLSIMSLCRLNEFEFVQTICDQLTAVELSHLSTNDAVNLLNVITKNNLIAPIDVLVKNLVLQMDTFDHRSGTLFIVSLSRVCEVDQSILPIVEKWSISQLTENWTPQSISLFSYSLKKLNWAGKINFSKLIAVQVSKSNLTEYTDQNLCLVLMGCSEQTASTVLRELHKRGDSVGRKDLVFLLKNFQNYIASWALHQLLNRRSAMSPGEWSAASRHIDLSRHDEFIFKIPLSTLFYVISQTNFYQPIQWHKYSVDESIDSTTASRILQTIARLELHRHLPDRILMWAINSLDGGSVLGLISLATIPKGLALAGPQKLVSLVEQIKVLNSVDVRQLQRFLCLVDDTNVLKSVLHVVPKLRIVKDNESLLAPRSSRAQKQVHATLKQVTAVEIRPEVPIPEIASNIDFVIAPSSIVAP